MRAAWILLPLALVACGRKPAGLPEDPIKRAATCGVVAAADARRALGSVDAKLSIEQQGHILQYALMEGAADGSFDRTRSAAVVNAMPQLGDKVTGGKWEPLVGECADAYPATRPVESVTLPSDPLTVQAGCHDLSDFITTALRSQENNYIDRMRAYDAMERKLDNRMGATLKARGLNQLQANEARAKAFAKVVTLGPPIVVLDQCVKKYGS
jgi:hypothetical protein